MSHAVVDSSAKGFKTAESTPPTPEVRRSTGLFSRLAGSIPTLLVFVGFTAIFYYGHKSDWTLPKFSSLVGSPPPEAAAWCDEHGVPEAICVECDPLLMPKGPDYGWCRVHGVHNCTLEHPDIAQLKETPVITEAEFQTASRALALKERPENEVSCSMYQKRIQFASIESVLQAGVDVELVERQPIAEWVSGNGEIVYDPTRFASLSSRVPGIVWRVDKQVGNRVRAGDVLALVDAKEVGRAKSELVMALAEEELRRQTLDRLSQLGGVVAGRKVLEAQTQHSQSQAGMLSAQQSLINLGLPVDIAALSGLSKQELVQRVRFLGLPQRLASELDPQVTTANLVPILAPLDGVVVNRQVVAGEVVDMARTLFQVADPSRMWLMLNVVLEDAQLLAVGQPVRFLPDGSRTEVAGELNWISTAADKQTRMVTVRAELPNPDGQLRDETYGAGRIILRKEPNAIVVPNNAVHWEGCCHIIFVRDKGYFDSPESPKVFHVRSVRVGVKNGKLTEIIAGLLPGEVVTTTGSDVLRAQLLKNNLGEGCTCGQ